MVIEKQPSVLNSAQSKFISVMVKYRLQNRMISVYYQ
jgi:hypothetical protein